MTQSSNQVSWNFLFVRDPTIAQDAPPLSQDDPNARMCQDEPMAQNGSMMYQNGPQTGPTIRQTIPDIGNGSKMTPIWPYMAMTATAVLLLLLLLRAKEKPNRKIWFQTAPLKGFERL